jgi:nucleotide sugar dehydrogenase
MPAVLKIMPEEIDTNEKRSKFTISIVGCGQKGILFANAFADNGFKVICSDADASVIKKIAKGKTPFSNQKVESKLKILINAGQLTVANDVKKAVSQSDVVVVTVPAKIDDQKKINFSQALDACKHVGAALRVGTLVIYGDIAAFGFIERLMKEALENTSGLKVEQDFGLAYVPIHSSDAQLTKPIADLELKVGAIGNASMTAATNILKTITNNVKQIDDLKTAEAATLFAVARQDANTALSNELAIFCENANIDFFEVLSTETGDKIFFPTVAEQINKDESYLLLENAENINVKLRLPALSRQINEDMVKHAVNLTQDALRSCGKTLRRARVGVLGTVKQNTSTGIFVKILALKGAKVGLYDPTSKGDSLDSSIVKSGLNETVEGADCIVILTGEEYFRNLNLKKLKPLTKTPSVIVDLAGVYKPEQAETEGFIYRGLGRGVEQQ